MWIIEREKYERSKYDKKKKKKKNASIKCLFDTGYKYTGSSVADLTGANAAGNSYFGHDLQMGPNVENVHQKPLKIKQE